MMNRAAGAALLTVALALPAAAETKPPVTWYPACSTNYTHYYSTPRSINMIVIHDIEGSYWGAISWFQNCSSKVSAHYVVSYGGAIAQMVTDNDMAWHVAYYNTHSIGIEHEGYASRNNWTDAEYRSSAALTAYLTATYAVPRDRSHIVAHSELGQLGGGHSDPGPYFNWTYYMSLVGGTVSPPPPATTTQARKVTASALNVRSGPGTGYSIIGTVYSGQVYIQNASQSGWSKIWYDGREGWVSTTYTTALSGVSAIKVATTSLNVRTGPGTGYSIVGTISNGQMYFWTSNPSGWYQIYWGGSGSRYCSGGYVTRVAL